MQLPLVSFLVIFLRVSQCRVPGQTWGGAFKPTGLNTIIRNQCITSNGGGFFHHKGTEEARATSKLVAEVAGPVTSRAVLALLLKVNTCCICLSAQSIVHLTAQIQNMETRVANFFGGCRGPHFGPTNTIDTKNYQKNTRGPIFTKTTKNALQCTTVHCNVTS